MDRKGGREDAFITVGILCFRVPSFAPLLHSILGIPLS
jgi:hypothetical protein